jgi:hypothetical protein
VKVVVEEGEGVEVKVFAGEGVREGGMGVSELVLEGDNWGVGLRGAAFCSRQLTRSRQMSTMLITAILGLCL